MKILQQYWWLIAIVLIFFKFKKTAKKTTIVNVGDTGDDVQRLQSWVVNKGKTLDIDGIFGEITAIQALSAILQFKDSTGEYRNVYYEIGQTSYGQNTGLHSVDLNWLFNENN